MSTNASSAIDALRTKIEAHLAEATGDTVKVHAFEKLAGGACQDNFAITIQVVKKGHVAKQGAHESSETPALQKLVLRSDASSSLPGSLDRAQEYAVICAAAAAGVRTPQARWLARDLTRAGAYAYFLDWAEGDAIGRRVVTGPKLEAARRTLANECAGELARIHAITPKTHPSLFPEGLAQCSRTDPAGDACAFVRGMIDRMHEPRPALELALRWLRAHAPETREITLVHGDFRTGNFMVSADGLRAVLDWEFAHWGSPAEDLAWISVRDWRFGQLKKPIGGFASRDAFYAAYEKASGAHLDRREIHWWEVMGNVRWSAASIHQGERYMSGADPDIELVAVARRAIEMEYEALRLIAKGAA